MSHLEVRLARLKATQNRDGGWGYFAGKQSWLEPTAYAALALAGEPAADRAWALIETLQNPDGSFRPAAEVELPNWSAALVVTLARSRKTRADRAVAWLLNVAGEESSLKNRLAARIGVVKPERDTSLKGWPWKPGNSSWVEPTTHTIVALHTTPEARDRVSMGRRLLLDVRCPDGGWNYGSAAALGQGLASYPETTGIALVGLQGVAGLGASLDLAAKHLEDAVSPMARAWLSIAMRLHGAQFEGRAADSLPPDLQAVALEALSDASGNYRVFKTEAA